MNPEERATAAELLSFKFLSNTTFTNQTYVLVDELVNRLNDKREPSNLKLLSESSKKISNINARLLHLNTDSLSSS